MGPGISRPRQYEGSGSTTGHRGSGPAAALAGIATSRAPRSTTSRVPARVTFSGRERKTPGDGSTTSPGTAHDASARVSAAVSSVRPSPTAPKSVTRQDARSRVVNDASMRTCVCVCVYIYVCVVSCVLQIAVLGFSQFFVLKKSHGLQQTSVSHRRKNLKN
jgi:hypothetical protein